MDKKNLTIGVVLLLAALASMYYTSKSVHPSTPMPPPAPAAANPAAPAANPGAGATVAAPAATVQPAAFTGLAKDHEGAQIELLANNFVEVRLTNYGGAIREVALRKYPETQGSEQPFIFNRPRTDPMLGFVDLPGLDRATEYQLVAQSAKEVTYRAVFDGRVEVTRRYTLPDGSQPGTDPYQLQSETTFRNLTDQTVALPQLGLSLGTSAPLDSSVYGLQVTSGYSDGKDQHFTEQTKLQGGGFLSLIGLGSKEPTPFVMENAPIVWASVGDQFFTSILTPSQPGVGLLTRRVPLPPFPDNPKRPDVGLSAAAFFNVKALPPHGETKLGMDLYVGPKEYRRLANGDIFKHDQDKVMNFGFFRFFSQILLTLMTWVYGWMHDVSPLWAWGWAVVITTFLLKVVFMPFTLAASRSGKRMQKIQPEMKALREKYKDNPQKMQAATMELFKKHKVNPVGGCIPMLITIPFFFGFFTMLRSAAELRFEPFLWAHDLTSPDTVAHVFGFPLNIMPLVMGATMIYQMHITPQPTVDNAQAKMFKFMPWIFMLFCYNYSCALALYMTISYLFTIGQQIIINRMKDDGDPAPVEAAGGKTVKNVTPKKR